MSDWNDGSFPDQQANPYASGTLAPPPPRPQSVARKMPVFPMVMFILSLVFTVLRVPLVLFGFVALTALADIPPSLMATVPFELGSGSAIVVFGLAANILLLMKKNIGVPLGWCLVASVVFSLAVGLWQGGLQAGEFEAGSPEQIGAFIGLGFVTVLRIVILAMYITALVWIGRWFNEASAESRDAFR